jgi:hypothetical protein
VGSTRAGNWESGNTRGRTVLGGEHPRRKLGKWEHPRQDRGRTGNWAAEETGRWLCALIPEQTPTYKIKGDKLTVLTEKQAMKFYKETCEINAVVYNIKGTSQGTRNPLMIVTGGGQQLGSVQVQPGHAATAFVLTKAVMADLKNDFDRNGIQPSRSVFFERRDVYLSAD